MNRKFLTPDEIAAQLRVSSEVIRRLLRRRELPAIRVGRAWRIEEDEFRRWVSRRLVKISPPSGGGPCLCGCGGVTITAGARFLPGHDGKLIHRLMTERGLTFDAARETVRRMHRPRVQERLF
ncbi:MAG TPA: helix-turn-helix domain-containing protein [bacterium]|nr:helix-turn-helix domain-containing protein [bacterium]